MKTTITPGMLKALRIDMDAALAGLRKKYGLSQLACGRATYDPSAGTLTMKVEGVGEGAKGKEAALYESAAFLGLPPLGFSFASGMRTYKTTGLNSTGTKVLCSRDDGKTYLFPVETVKRYAAAKNQKPPEVDAT